MRAQAFKRKLTRLLLRTHVQDLPLLAAADRDGVATQVGSDFVA